MGSKGQMNDLEKLLKILRRKSVRDGEREREKT